MANKDIKKNVKKPKEETTTTSVAVQSTVKQGRVNKKDMPATVIMRCTCDHEVQDKMYGKGMRVHNRIDGGKAAKEPIGYCCTVCTPNLVNIGRKAEIQPAAPAFGITFSIPAKLPRIVKQL